jgi:hypothetical protein
MMILSMGFGVYAISGGAQDSPRICEKARRQALLDFDQGEAARSFLHVMPLSQLRFWRGKRREEMVPC